MHTAIMAINPGTTTIRVALHAPGQAGNVDLISERHLEHEEAEMARYTSIPAQLDYRAGCVAAFLDETLAGHRDDAARRINALLLAMATARAKQYRD